MTKDGLRTPNYYGSLTQAATVRVGNVAGEEVHAPLASLAPFVHPNDLVLGGWDISAAPLADAMERAAVLDWELQRQIAPHLKDCVPLPAAFDPAFVAPNQAARADNVLGGSKAEQLDALRGHIREFKQANALDTVVILWTANTERFADVAAGVNDTEAALLASIEAGHPEVAPSQLYAVASILEGCPFLNGSPQNTFVPGLVELAVSRGVLVAGDDFKSGQTKMKSVLVDFLVGAGLKPTAIVSYNHLGNNDGLNLSAPHTFRSKEVSKSNVVDDMVRSNGLLYGKGEHPDHVVVIKYVPTVGDSKRAMDEYTSEIFMGGTSTIVMHNTCEDSLLAAPIILDLAIVAELLTRITLKKDGETEFRAMHPVASLLSYLTKAPLVKDGAPVVNALAAQRAALENVLRAAAGLPADNHTMMEFRE